MPEVPFSLLRFEAGGPHAGLAAGGSLCLEGSRLTARWRLDGDLAALSIPEPAAAPLRRDGLWRDTCFELFLASPASPGYREFNLAPAGDWNAYSFTAYRQGMQPIPAAQRLPFTIDRTAATFTLTLQLPAELLPEADGPLVAAACAVLRSGDGPPSHWALRHGGQRPDFHRRDSFLLRLEP